MKLQIQFFESLNANSKHKTSPNTNKLPLKSRSSNLPERQNAKAAHKHEEFTNRTTLLPQKPKISAPKHIQMYSSPHVITQNVSTNADTESIQLNHTKFNLNSSTLILLEHEANVSETDSVFTSGLTNTEKNISTPSGQKSSHDLLLGLYAEKLKELNMFEKKVELCKFELLEISVQIEDDIRQLYLERVQSQGEGNNTAIYQEASLRATMEMLNLGLNISNPSNSNSNPFELFLPAISSLTKMASTIFETSVTSVSPRKTQPSILSDSIFDAASWKERAQSIFSTPHDGTGRQAFLESSNIQFDMLSDKTSHLFNLFMCSLAPDKIPSAHLPSREKDTDLEDSFWLKLPERTCSNEIQSFNDSSSESTNHDLLKEVDIDDCNSNF